MTTSILDEKTVFVKQFYHIFFPRPIRSNLRIILERACILPRSSKMPLWAQITCLPGTHDAWPVPLAVFCPEFWCCGKQDSSVLMKQRVRPSPLWCPASTHVSLGSILSIWVMLNYHSWRCCPYSPGQASQSWVWIPGCFQGENSVPWVRHKRVLQRERVRQR